MMSLHEVTLWTMKPTCPPGENDQYDNLSKTSENYCIDHSRVPLPSCPQFPVSFAPSCSNKKDGDIASTSSASGSGLETCKGMSHECQL